MNQPEPALPPVDGSEPADDDLRGAVQRLEEELAELRLVVAQQAGERRALSGAEAASEEEAPRVLSLAKLDAAGEAALHSEVARALSRIEEEKAEAAWQEELEERAEEALAANSEYDELERTLDERVDRLSEALQLGTWAQGELRALISQQNDRNRQMTRVWSQGELSEEEVEQIFLDNRAAHRAEVRAVLGEEGIPGYRRFLREGGLGGRFSFFTGPWEDWADEEPGGDGSRR